MKRHIIVSLFLLNSLCLFADIDDYIYPYNDQPSFSNYGTVGLIQMPSARMHDEGTLGFTWSLMQPYLRGSLVATPFSWFEASYQYTDVNNKLYSEFVEFSGKQSYKDKGIDAKLRLIKESKNFPQVAFGFRDLGGSGLFGAEYIVASKKVSNVDITAGIGWGMISENEINNPFKYISDRFSEGRVLDSGTGDSQGGEFNVNTWFKGKKSGTFFGAEVLLPRLKGTRFKFEYDGNNYLLEGAEPVKQKHRVNYSFLYPVTQNLHLKLGYVRGNTLNFGFSYSGNYKNRDPFIKKNNKPKVVPRAEVFKIVNARSDINLYRSSLKYLSEEKVFLQTAQVEDDKYKISFTQGLHTSHPRAVGRIVRILDQISPDTINTFELTNMNTENSMYTMTIDRNEFNKYKNQKAASPLLYSTEIKKIHSNQIERDHEFKPTKSFPLHFWKIAPSIRSQIGGPDGFYFGEVSLGLHSDLLINGKMNILTIASVGLFDNFDELKLASDSVLPHVRTDIVKYLKNSKDGNVRRMQFNYIENPIGSLFYKFSAGIFEQMFGGYGGEILYRPFFSDWGLGAEIWRVKQRDFQMLFGFQDYETTTGHLNFYYREPKSQVLIHLKGGRYLAEDSGITLDLSRRFKSGMTLGIFATKTDISKQEFGEGSFDKGFYFHMPIEIFYDQYSRGVTGFGLRPVTRDGGQFMYHGFNLWSVTDQSQVNNLIRDWETVYD